MAGLGGEQAGGVLHFQDGTDALFNRLGVGTFTGDVTRREERHDRQARDGRMAAAHAAAEAPGTVVVLRRRQKLERLLDRLVDLPGILILLGLRGSDGDEDEQGEPRDQGARHGGFLQAKAACGIAR